MAREREREIVLYKIDKKKPSRDGERERETKETGFVKPKKKISRDGDRERNGAGEMIIARE